MNRLTKKILLVLKKSLFLTILFFLFWSCKNDVKDVIALTKHYRYPEVRAIDINILRSDSAKLYFQLFANEMIQYSNNDKPYILFPSGFYSKHFDVYPVVESSIKADWAKYFVNEKLWLAKSNVVAVNSEGEKLFAEELYWDQDKKIIYSDKYVKIQTADEIIFGDGFEADQDMEHYKIKKVKGTVYIND